jgi:hypothetical protein
VSRPTESWDEELARDIVSTVLGVPAERFEDGTAPAQIDALIDYPDRRATLEIVADVEPTFRAQQAALYGKHKEAVEVSELRKSWMVVLRPEANIKNVKRRLPALLLDLQDNPTPQRKPSDFEPSELHRLGIWRASPMDRSTTPGRVRLFQQPFGGFVGDERTVGGWAERVLREQFDVPAKLAAHIWVTITSDMGVQMQLEPGEDQPFPVTPPQLPAGVTHVWVADQVRFKGVLAWFPDRGWWRTPWTWPPESQVAPREQEINL